MTTETKLTEGKHYWEVELLSKRLESINIGISRPNLDPAGYYTDRGCTDAWFMYAFNGSLFGNGKERDDAAGTYKQGDRVGVLLDLDNGSLRFFKNGVEHGPGYAAGSVTGPVVHAVHLREEGASVRLLPNAEAPAGV
jgi:ABC-type molybdate transport system substrate-binding protein